MKTVRLRPRKALPFYGRHPWALDSALETVDKSVAPGDAVRLVNDKGQFIAHGLYNPNSRIRVRLYSWREETPLDAAFWTDRVNRAIRLREDLNLLGQGEACRLVFSESDGLSGLIVDRFADWLVIQPTALGIYQRRDEIVAALQERLSPRGVLVRADASTAEREGFEEAEPQWYGEIPQGPIEITENGLKYEVDLISGQKTGFYLDQRDNRRVAGSLCRGKRVLDVCCYTGGFGLNALRQGAAEVLAVDSSEHAIEQARRHAELNGLSNYTVERGDAFPYLERLVADGRKFDVVILDPPKFAGRRSRVEDALRAYHRLNRFAVDLLAEGGYLVTCSCSGNVTREQFLINLTAVAQKSRREVQVLEQRGAAPDHPVSATCLESEYLKCFIARVGPMERSIDLPKVEPGAEGTAPAERRSGPKPKKHTGTSSDGTRLGTVLGFEEEADSAPPPEDLRDV